MTSMYVINETLKGKIKRFKTSFYYRYKSMGILKRACTEAYNRSYLKEFKNNI